MNIKLTNKPNETLYIYCRVSTTKQDEDGHSLNVQEERGLKVSKRLGISPIVIKEQGSGLKPYIEERPLFTKLMDNVVDGNIKHFWIDEDTRLTRNDLDQPFIHSEFSKYGITLYLGERGEIKKLDDFGTRLVDMVRVMINQNEIRKQVRKGIRSKRKLFSEGCYMKGPPTFGYKLVDKRLEIDEENSEWVKKIYDWYDGGKSTVWIRQQLFQNQVIPPFSKKDWFSLTTITNILSNKNYIGIDTYGDLTNTCPTIIEKNVFNSVQKKFKTKSSRSIETKHDFLLRGIIKCSDGRDMSIIGKKKSNKNPLYSCGHKQRYWKNREKMVNCPTDRSLRSEILDDYIWGTMVSTLSQSHHIKELTKQELLGKKSFYTKRTYKNKIKKLNKEMMSLDTNRLELEKRFYTNQMEKKRYDILINSIEDRESDLMNEIQSNQMKLDTLNKKSDWIDWIDIHNDRMDEIRDETDFNKRRGIINHYIHEILVLNYDVDTKEHTLSIKFRFPLFDDSFEWLKNKDGSYKLDKWGRRRYNIHDGETEMLNPFTLQYPISSDKLREPGSCNMTFHFNYIGIDSKNGTAEDFRIQIRDKR